MLNWGDQGGNANSGSTLMCRCPQTSYKLSNSFITQRAKHRQHDFLLKRKQRQFDWLTLGLNREIPACFLCLCIIHKTATTRLWFLSEHTDSKPVVPVSVTERHALSHHLSRTNTKTHLLVSQVPSQCLNLQFHLQDIFRQLTEAWRWCVRSIKSMHYCSSIFICSSSSHKHKT